MECQKLVIHFLGNSHNNCSFELNRKTLPEAIFQVITLGTVARFKPPEGNLHIFLISWDNNNIRHSHSNYGQKSSR